MNLFRYSFLFCVIAFTLFLPHQGFAKVWDAYAIMDHSVPNMCAITFDDGPVPLTEELLDALKEEKVPATFLVLGQNAAVYPKIIKRMVKEGHEIGSHGYSHANLREISPEAAYNELRKTNAVLKKHGVAPRFFRPPYGSYNRNIVSQAAQMGMSTLLWSVDSRDWERVPDYGNMQNILNRPMTSEEMRGVFLFHDIKKRTVRDARLIIMVLRAVGCRYFVTVSDYFRAKPYDKSYDNTPLILAQPNLENSLMSKVDNKQLEFNFKPAPMESLYKVSSGANAKSNKSNDNTLLLNESPFFQNPFFGN